MERTAEAFRFAISFRYESCHHSVTPNHRPFPFSPFFLSQTPDGSCATHTTHTIPRSFLWSFVDRFLSFFPSDVLRCHAARRPEAGEAPPQHPPDSAASPPVSLSLQRSQRAKVRGASTERRETTRRGASISVVTFGNPQKPKKAKLPHKSETAVSHLVHRVAARPRCAMLARIEPPEQSLARTPSWYLACPRVRARAEALGRSGLARGSRAALAPHRPRRQAARVGASCSACEGRSKRIGATEANHPHLASSAAGRTGARARCRAAPHPWGSRHGVGAAERSATACTKRARATPMPPFGPGLGPFRRSGSPAVRAGGCARGLFDLRHSSCRAAMLLHRGTSRRGGGARRVARVGDATASAASRVSSSLPCPAASACA